MSQASTLTSEQRTAAFQARMARKQAPLVRRAWEAAKEKIGGKHRGRRIAALALAIGVPAVAAPSQWEKLQPSEPEIQLAETVKAMPFEQPGHSFPGSAFYYLEDAPRLTIDAGEHDLALFDMSGTGDVEKTELVIADKAGPAARAFNLYGGGLDKARALQCMTSAVYYEAASEAAAGQRAVAQVVLNRVSHPSYPNSVCGVVFQGSERRTGCQFSFTCDGSLNRQASVGAWSRAQQIAQRALNGSVYQPVGLATHYHTVWINPYWAPSLDHIGTIGAHRFYRWKGLAGKPAAFEAKYAGREPAAAPAAARSASVVPKSKPADPVTLARAYEEARLKALAEAKQSAATRARTPAPTYSAEIERRGGESLYSGEKLPESGSVKPEYANSGRWIAEPN